MVPTGDYSIHQTSQQLDAADFKARCINNASSDSAWAYLGPGNWGGWIILFSELDRQPVCIFIQSKQNVATMEGHTGIYPLSGLDVAASKCWNVEGVPSCLLYITDERDSGCDNEVLDVGDGLVKVVTASRNSHISTFGIIMEAPEVLPGSPGA